MNINVSFFKTKDFSIIRAAFGPFDKVEYARAYYVMKFGDESNECNCVNH